MKPRDTVLAPCNHDNVLRVALMTYIVDFGGFQRLKRAGMNLGEHIDDESILVFSSLLQQMSSGELDSALFIVLAIRSSDMDVETQAPFKDWLSREDVVRLDIGPIDDEAATELVQRTAHGGTLPHDVVRFVLRNCNGIPLHLEMMSRSLVGSDLLFLSANGCYELEGDITAMSLPTSLRESIRLQLAIV